MWRYLSPYILMFLSCSLCCVTVSFAGNGPEKEKKLSMLYDLDFEMNFDNREYDCTDSLRSMTIFGARLSPVVGLSVKQSNRLNHKLLVGFDLMKEFGASRITPEMAGESLPEEISKDRPVSILREITLNYALEARFGKTDFTFITGVFPRKLAEGEYSTAFFSDSLVFYDNNLEGALFKFKRPGAYYEVGCDWMGQFGSVRRERFMIFSHGHGIIADFLNMGYSAYMYHYAESRNVRGVMDNFLLNPYVEFDLRGSTGLQEMSVSLGWLQSLQNDRKHSGKYVFPCGGQITAEVRNWNIGLRNELFYGSDMLPFYDGRDDVGVKYGNLLYFGDYFYKIKGKTGIYDRLAVYYEPHISDFLDIRLAVNVHFNGGFAGWQQMLSLKFNLQSLLSK